MKFTIQRNDLLPALQKALAVCATRKKITGVLACCRIEAVGDHVEIQAAGLDMAIRVVAAGGSLVVDQVGVAVVNLKRLTDTLKNSEKGQLTLAHKGIKWLEVTTSKSVQRLALDSGADFLPIGVACLDNARVIASEALLNMIRQALPCVSKGTSRPSFMGAFLRFDDEDGVVMVATDGHRLTRARRALVHDAQGTHELLKKGVIIPRVALNTILRKLKLTDGGGAVWISVVESDHIDIMTTELRLRLRLIPGRFPNFDDVIPESFAHTVQVERKALQAALKRAKGYRSELRSFDLTVIEDAFIVRAKKPTVCDFEERLDCQYTGDGFDLRLDHEYVVEALRVIKGDHVIIDVVDHESPAIFRDPTDDGLTIAVMPKRPDD